MIKRLCVFTLYFAYNRQVRLKYLEKILPKDVELFLFTTKTEKPKFNLKRFKIYTSENKFSSFVELRKFCKEYEIDAILNLGQLPQEGYIMTFSTLLTKTKSFIYMVGNPFFTRTAHRKDWRFKAFIESIFFFPLLYFPDKFFFASPDLVKKIKKLPMPKSKIKYLPGTVDINLFKPSNKQQTRKKLNLQNKKIVIFVGRIEYAKGSDIIFKLAKKNPEILFLLIGKLDNENKNKTKPKNIRIFPPQQSENLKDYYNAADLCFFPSRVEGFGLVPREAMACGTPALVSDIPALRMIKQAIKIPIKTKEFNKAIKNFFKLSKRQKQELSRKSREEIIKQYSQEGCKDLYLRNLLK